MIPLKDNIRSRTWPVVNVLLILMNAAVFVFEAAQPDPASLEILIRHYGVIPQQLVNSPLSEGFTLLTSMFLHGGWSHIIGNMLYLWIFGDNVEDRLGHGRYLIFYLSTGMAAALFQVYFFPTSSIPTIGASGAIAGVLGAYFLLYPKARVLALVPIWIFVRVIEIPALFFLGFWFVIQAFQGWGSLLSSHADTGGVAWWAHAGGFLAGFLLAPVLKKRKHR